MKFVVAGIDLRFSTLGGPPVDEKLCDCGIWFCLDGYDAGTTGVGTGAGKVGGGPGFGPPTIPPDIRRNCLDCRYIIVSPNIRVGEASS